MRTIGSIERFLVLGIVVVIGSILAVAIRGAHDKAPAYDSQVAAKGGGDPKRDPKKIEPAKPAPQKPAPKLEPKGDAKPEAKAPDVKPDVKAPPALKNDIPVAPAPAAKPAEGETPKNPMIDDLLNKQINAKLGNGGAPPAGRGEAGDPKGDVDAPPVVIESTPGGKSAVPPAGPANGAGSKAPAPIAPPVPVAVPVMVKEYSYTIRSGDSLERIARTFYGDGKLWTEIRDANPSVGDGHAIRLGSTIKLPKEPTQALDQAIVANVPAPADLHAIAPDPKLAAGNVAAPPKEPVKDAPKDDKAHGEKGTLANGGDAKPSASAFKRIKSDDQHTVAKGETLSSIALEHYGTKAAWKLILDANTAKIADKDHVKVGTVLHLPAN